MDDIDRAQAVIEQRDAERERKIIERPKYEVPPGEPGDCEFCGEWSGRLVGGACAPCREKYHLP